MSSTDRPNPPRTVLEDLEHSNLADHGLPDDGLGPALREDEPLADEARELRWSNTATRLREGDSYFAIVSLVTGLLIMEIGARILNVQYFPPISAVLGRLIQLTRDGEILSDVLRSVQNLSLGFSITLVVGVTVGLLMGRFSAIEKMLDPYVIGFMTSPTVVFAPVYFSIFGLARWSIVLLIVQYSLFIVIVNTVTAVHSVDRELVEMSSVFGAGERQRLWKIVLPASLPLIMAGLRLGMGRAVKGMINGELLIAVVGLGATSQNFARARDAEGVFAILIVVILVALAAVKIVEIIDSRVNSWLPNAQR
jgi:NitT/TauT family transport system permease protein